MFLFEGRFGNILHTGDCRLTPECLQSLPEKFLGKKGKEPRCQLDYVFLDCTFGRFPLKMPSRQSAIQQVHTFFLSILILEQLELVVLLLSNTDHSSNRISHIKILPLIYSFYCYLDWILSINGYTWYIVRELVYLVLCRYVICVICLKPIASYV